MMPWQGHPDILIDRFDVRAHLDTIIENPSAKNEEEILNYEERTMNYERYRILVQNEFLGGENFFRYFTKILSLTININYKCYI